MKGVDYMITLYFIGKMFGFMVKLIIWMITLPFQMLLAPLKGFKNGVSRKRLKDDFWFIYF